jgi:hypothetical protein
MHRGAENCLEYANNSTKKYMKYLIIALIAMFGFTFSANAQTRVKKDGTPDMRYKENKQVYGQPTYKEPKQTYTQPTYNQPTYNGSGNRTKKDGTPDMRYKENKPNYDPYKMN